jgi:thiol reductant ABC exporter CydD subunit/thiol reductant ABC exporter CydC subunit
MKRPAKSTQKAALRWLQGQTRHCRLWMGLACGCGAAFGLLVIWQAWLMARIVHGAFMEGIGLAELMPALAALMGVFALRAAFRWAREICGFTAGARIRTRLRDQLSAHWFDQGPIRMARHPAGALTAAAMEQVEALQGYYALYLPQLAVAAIVPGAVAAMVLPVSWAAGGLLLFTAPLIPLFMVLVGMGAESASQRHFQALARMSAHFLDTLKGLTTLKLLGRSKDRAAEVTQTAEAHRRHTMKVLQIAFLSSAVLEFFSAMAIALVAVYLGMRHLGYYDFGSWGATLNFQQGFFILLLAPEFYWPLRELGTHYHARAEAVGAAIEIMPLMPTRNNPPASPLLPATDPSRSPAAPPPLAQGQVHFDAVSFAYPGDRDGPVIEGLSFRLAPGTVTALVGASGAGKTTVVNLLLGFLLPTGGQIRMPGGQSTAVDWRREMAWVGQKPLLFQGSLADNIRLARPEASLSEVRRAAGHAGVLPFADRLPEGLDTRVGEDGAGLSRGQAQRVALARAFLKDAPVLVLDEPTASLDSDSEAVVMAAIARLTQGRTVLMVTHRLDLLARVDQVLVLENGRLSQAGRYADLKSAGGALSRLVTPVDPQFPGRRDADGTAPVDGAAAPAATLPPDRSPAPGPVWPPLLRRMGRQWPWMLLGAFLGWAALSAGVGLLALSGWFLSAAAHAGLAVASAQAFNFFLPSIGVRLCAMVRTAARYAERLVTHNTTFKILAELRGWYYRRLEPLAPAGLLRFRSGDLLNRIVADIDVLDNLYARVLSPFASALLVVALVGVGLTWVDRGIATWALAWLGLGALILPAAVTGSGRSAGRRLARQMAGMRGLLVDGLRGMAELLVFEADGSHRRRLARYHQRLVSAQFRMSMVTGFGAAAVVTLSGLATVTTLYLGVARVHQGQMAGTLLALAVLAVLAAFESIQPLLAAFQYLGQTREAGIRLMAVVRQPPPVTFRREDTRRPGDGAVVFDGVSFAYPGQADPVFSDLSLTIASGEHVVLVGESGAGKSTLTALLARFWDPTRGRIALGGRDLKQLSESDLRRSLGVMDQGAHLFNDTVRANLLLAAPDADETQLVQALDRACLLEAVNAMPQGLDTWVGELGHRLSGGQARRLAVARTLLRNAGVWVLDEPTEGLDGPTADRMMQGILTAARGRTLVVITHRPVASARFDRLLRLEAGQVLAV